MHAAYFYTVIPYIINKSILHYMCHKDICNPDDFFFTLALADGHLMES